MPELELQGVSKTFGSTHAVREIDLRVESGRRLAIVGPSGSGKSTLLRLIAGLDSPDHGIVQIDGQPVGSQPIAARDVGMLFQDENLLPHLSVRGNLGFGLKLRGRHRSDIKPRVDQAANQLGVQALLDRYPRELSGGERQRVAVGRLMVTKPALWLLDEPFSQLDSPIRADLRRSICELHQACAATMIYVTHDQAEALTLGDQIAVLGDGRLHQLDEPETVYKRPANQFVASFIGSPPMNLIPCKYNAPWLDLLGTKVKVDALPATDVVCGFRPEALELASAQAIQLDGRVRSHEFLGHEVILQVDVENTLLYARYSVRSPRFSQARQGQPGESIKLGVHADDICVFSNDSDGQLIAASIRVQADR